MLTSLISSCCGCSLSGSVSSWWWLRVSKDGKKRNLQRMKNGIVNDNNSKVKSLWTYHPQFTAGCTCAILAHYTCAVLAGCSCHVLTWCVCAVLHKTCPPLFPYGALAADAWCTTSQRMAKKKHPERRKGKRVD